MATFLEHAGIDELAERGDILVEARIGRTFDDENNLPERHDVVGRLGRADDFEPIDYSFFPFDAENNLPEHHEVAGRLGRANDFEPIDYSFFPFDAVDLYNMLNWVRETE